MKNDMSYFSFKMLVYFLSALFAYFLSVQAAGYMTMFLELTKVYL